MKKMNGLSKNIHRSNSRVSEYTATSLNGEIVAYRMFFEGFIVWGKVGIPLIQYSDEYHRRSKCKSNREKA